MKTIEQEVKKLDLKLPEDYKKFSKIREEYRSKFKEQMERGRVPEYDFIREKEAEYFPLGRQGFEYTEDMYKHHDRYYSSGLFETFEQEEFYIKDMSLQAKRRVFFPNLK